MRSLTVPSGTSVITNTTALSDITDSTGFSDPILGSLAPFTLIPLPSGKKISVDKVYRTLASAMDWALYHDSNLIFEPPNYYDVAIKVQLVHPEARPEIPNEIIGWILNTISLHLLRKLGLEECNAEIFGTDGTKWADLSIVSLDHPGDSSTTSARSLRIRGSSEHTWDPSVYTDITLKDEMDEVAWNGFLASVIAAQNACLHEFRPSSISVNQPDTDMRIVIVPPPGRALLISKEVVESLVDIMERQFELSPIQRPTAMTFEVVKNSAIVGLGSVTQL